MRYKTAALAVSLALALLLTSCGHGDQFPRPEFAGSPMLYEEE